MFVLRFICTRKKNVIYFLNWSKQYKEELHYIIQLSFFFPRVCVVETKISTLKQDLLVWKHEVDLKHEYSKSV